MKRLQRMTKGSKLRRLAQRALPARLRAHRQELQAEHLAKRRRPPRVIQRTKAATEGQARRLAAKLAEAFEPRS